MTGDRANPDDPELPNDDVGESTVAMAAPPSFSNVPLPISTPPPPAPARGPSAQVQVPRAAGLPRPAATPGPGPAGAGAPAKRAHRATQLGLAPPPALARPGMARPDVAAPRSAEAAAAKPEPVSGAAEAARATPSGPLPSSNRSPLATTAFAPTRPKSESSEDVAKAAPRDEAPRARDAHVILGDDDEASGEDATLAVAPENNEARNQIIASFAHTMMAHERGAPPAALAPPSQHQAPAMQPGVPAPQGWHDQQSWNASPSRAPMPSAPGYQSPPRLPLPSSPHPHLAPPIGGAAGGMPQQPMQGPTPYSGQHARVPAQTAGSQLGDTGVSKRTIWLLVAVGVVSLAIFITGVILFATSRR